MQEDKNTDKDMHPEEQLEVHPLAVEHNKMEEDSNLEEEEGKPDTLEEVEEDAAKVREYPLEMLQRLGD